jgi:hypothetical protein
MGSWSGTGGNKNRNEQQYTTDEESVMSKRKRRGKLNWRSKKANHGAKPTRG